MINTSGQLQQCLHFSLTPIILLKSQRLLIRRSRSALLSLSTAAMLEVSRKQGWSVLIISWSSGITAHLFPAALTRMHSHACTCTCTHTCEAPGAPHLNYGQWSHVHREAPTDLIQMLLNINSWLLMLRHANSDNEEQTDALIQT